LFKSIFFLYLIIFGCYIVFTRVPDYFDGEKYPATIVLIQDSATNAIKKMARYEIAGKQYLIDATYPFLNYSSNEKVTVIVEQEHIERGAVSRFWGYWITWGELAMSIIMAVVLFQVAVSITKNPTPESLIEQLGYKEEKKTKYD
jgi:hypothetical protein